MSEGNEHLQTHGSISSQCRLVSRNDSKGYSSKCQFCTKWIVAGSDNWISHVGSHMEAIAFAVVTKPYEDWEFYSDSSSSKSGGIYIHKSERPYTCQYCPRFFKNKNELERHQNSLHLRRHSWSCAALSSYEVVFHPSPLESSLGNKDLCGYCGQEFIVPACWAERIEHLTSVHKFGECNQSKKIFQPDHFRQHLKHSHAGKSGNWTDVLVNLCKKDEPPPISYWEEVEVG